jgi:hypothetical protein
MVHTVITEYSKLKRMKFGEPAMAFIIFKRNTIKIGQLVYKLTAAHTTTDNMVISEHCYFPYDNRVSYKYRQKVKLPSLQI